ncbi:unnamed protein product, partial [Heterosigma akashiwo]
GGQVFSLDYAIDGPACAVVHPKALVRYRRAFHLLWRVKRAEWALSGGWRDQTGK